MIAETARLRLQAFTPADAGFLLEVMNQPAYHRFIGDRGLRTVEDARVYLIEKIISSYEENGYGLWLIRTRDEDQAIGFAGIINRAELSDPDIGYALHQDYVGKGFAEEAARGVVEYNRAHLGIKTLLAITDTANRASIRVLEKCGFEFVRREIFFDDNEALNLFRLDAFPPALPGSQSS